MSKLRFSAVLMVLAGSILVLAPAAGAQQRGPGDISAEVAKAKADFFSRFSAMASDPTTNQDRYDAIYYYSHAEMTANCDHILRNFLGEPYSLAGVGDTESGGRISMAQNAPNPFTGTTRISFSPPVGQGVELSVCDVRGREVARLLDGKVEAGVHSVTWDGRVAAGHQAAPGVYWYRMRTADTMLTRRMVLLK